MDELFKIWSSDHSLRKHLLLLGTTGRGKSMLIEQRITDFGEVPSDTTPEIREAFKRLFARQSLRRQVTMVFHDNAFQTVKEGPFEPDRSFFKVDNPNWCVAGESLLTLAIAMEDEVAAFDLLRQGADPLAQDAKARNPLEVLLNWETVSAPLLEALIERGVGIGPDNTFSIIQDNQPWVEHAFNLIEKRKLNQAIPSAEKTDPPQPGKRL